MMLAIDSEGTGAEGFESLRLAAQVIETRASNMNATGRLNFNPTGKEHDGLVSAVDPPVVAFDNGSLVIRFWSLLGGISLV